MSDISLRQETHAYATRAKQEIDIDNPSIEALQALLLVTMVFLANGQGKKTYMAFCKSQRFSRFLKRYRTLTKDLICYSNLYRNGHFTRFVSRSVTKGKATVTRKRDKEKGILDLLHAGQAYTVWIETSVPYT